MNKTMKSAAKHTPLWYSSEHQEVINELAEALASARALRQMLLAQYGAVPKRVLDLCNSARAALAKAGRV